MFFPPLNTLNIPPCGYHSFIILKGTILAHKAWWHTWIPALWRLIYRRMASLGQVSAWVQAKPELQSTIFQSCATPHLVCGQLLKIKKSQKLFLCVHLCHAPPFQKGTYFGRESLPTVHTGRCQHRHWLQWLWPLYRSHCWHIVAVCLHETPSPSDTGDTRLQVYAMVKFLR